MNRKKLWLYDDSKEHDILDNPEHYKDLKAFIINNWIPTSQDVCYALYKVGVRRVYLSYKTYNIDIKTFDFDEFKTFIDKVNGLGIAGIALDVEAYSSSQIFVENTDIAVYIFFEHLSEIIRSSGLRIIMFPELMGFERYENYDSAYIGVKPRHLLTERTYETANIWDLTRFWLRNRKKPQIMGIWQDKVHPIFRPLQYYWARLLTNDVFWYTERKF